VVTGVTFEQVLDANEHKLSAWQRLQGELAAMEAWDSCSYSGYVGVDARGQFYAGANVEAEPWSADVDGYGYQFQADGRSPEECIDLLIAALHQYRADIDRQKAEDRAEQEAWDAEHPAP
jgi:hypothetical protein